MELDRRTFLRRCGELVVLTVAGRVALDVFTPLGLSARAAAAASGGSLAVGTPILVLIDLQGATTRSTC